MRISLQRVHHLGHVTQGKLAERGRAQQAAPGVEHHQRLRAGGGLGDQVGGDGLRQRIQQSVGQGRLVPAHGLERGEIARAMALDHVAGQRPRAAREADQRHAAMQFAADQAYGVHHIAQLAFHVGHAELVDVGLAAYRVCELRALALGKAQAQAHRVGDGEDVGEQDGRVQLEPLQRLQRHFAGEFRILRQRHEAAGAGAGGAVFGQVAAGLAHDPDRRGVGGLTAQGAQEAVVLQNFSHFSVRTGLPAPG